MAKTRNHSPLREINDSLSITGLAVFSRQKMPFEEGLAIAEARNKVLAPGLFHLLHPFHSILEDHRLYPRFSGLIAAYTLPGHRLASTVEYTDTHTGLRWVFRVPHRFQRLEGVLLVPHPFWVVEKDGQNRVVHSHRQHPVLFKNLPRQSGTYLSEWSLDRMRLMDKAGIAEFIRLGGCYRYSTPSGGGYKNLDAVVLSMTDRYVGPVVVGPDPRHHEIHSVWIDRSLSEPAYFMAAADTGIRENIVGLPPSNPLRTVRGLQHIETAQVHIAGEENPVSVAAGARLSILHEKLPFAFSCMRGVCYRCAARILGGTENLSPPS